MSIEHNQSKARFALCCVIDRHPRFYVELVLWVVCVLRSLPRDIYKPSVYFVDDIPQDLSSWLSHKRVGVHLTAPVVTGSPHCNKIAPFSDNHTSDWTLVTDADLFFVEDPSHFFSAARFRAPPNSHCNPPSHIFKSILAATGLKRTYRPGIALHKGGNGMRETHINNINGGFVAAPTSRSKELAIAWTKWANWLVKNRTLLDQWTIHVDQVGFALAMEDIGEDVDFLPPQTNSILHSFEETDSAYAFHLSSGHIPQFPHRIRPDRTLDPSGLSSGLVSAIEKLNLCIQDAVVAIKTLPSTREHLDKFLNPYWIR